MDRPPKMWSPTGERTNMDDFRERVNMELKLTLSEKPTGILITSGGWIVLLMYSLHYCLKAAIHFILITPVL